MHDEAHPDRATELRKQRPYDPLPLDPRDPNIPRAEQFMYVRRSHTKEEAMLEVGRDAEFPRGGERTIPPRCRSHG